jgi:hypothetical protein
LVIGLVILLGSLVLDTRLGIVYYKMLDPFDLAMWSSFSEDLKMFISPAEWRALRAQQNKVWREYADKSFASRKKKVEAKASARAGQVAQVGDLVLLRVDAWYASNRSSKWAGEWLGPLRVVAVTRSGLDITAQHIGSNVQVSRHARNFRRYLTNHDSDDELVVDNEYEVHDILAVRGDEDHREYLCSWEGYPSKFDSWESAHNLSKEYIRELEARFTGGARAAVTVPVVVSSLSSPAGKSPRLSRKATESAAGPVAASGAPEEDSAATVPAEGVPEEDLIVGNFKILGVKSTRRGPQYLVRRAGSKATKLVAEKQIPWECRERCG